MAVKSFPDRLAADHRVTAYLSRSAIDGLLEECGYNELPENGCGDLRDSGYIPAHSLTN